MNIEIFLTLTVTSLAPVCDCLQEPRKGTRLVFILVSPVTLCIEALSLFGTT